MLLVLVILATLAAIVYPKVAGRSEQARVTAAATQIGNFKTALNAFEVDNGYYPKGKDGLADLIRNRAMRQTGTGLIWKTSPRTPGAATTFTSAPANIIRPTERNVTSMGPPGKASRSVTGPCNRNKSSFETSSQI